MERDTIQGSDVIRVIVPGKGPQNQGNEPEVPPGRSGEHLSQGRGPQSTPPGRGGQPPSQSNQSGNQRQGKAKDKGK